MARADKRNMESKERIAQALSVSTDTKVFEMGQGIYRIAPDVLKEYFPGRKFVVVADLNTWAVLGEKVYECLVQSGIVTEKYIIGKEEFHADWKYVEMTGRIIEGDFDGAKVLESAEEYVDTDPGLLVKEPSSDFNVLVAVGSGVINDLCKLASHHHGQSYLCMPTAASVDGYSSFGASITYCGAKQTFNCPAPVAIVADIDVIAAAPKEMTAAGYADLAAKVPAGAEWMIADFVGSEPIIPQAWHILQDYIDDFLSDPDAVAAGDPKAIADLFEGLTLSGFAMQAARSSRPASCCDHLFSHFLDMHGHRFNGKLQSHGFQVAIGTLVMCAVFDELFTQDLCCVDVDYSLYMWPSLESEQQRAMNLFKNTSAPRLGYESITVKYGDKEQVREELESLVALWPDLKRKLQGQVYSFSKMQDLFRRAGAPFLPEHIGVTNSQLRDMFPYVQLMRHRYNLLDLAKRGCFYDDIVNPLFGAGGVFEVR